MPFMEGYNKESDYRDITPYEQLKRLEAQEYIKNKFLQSPSEASSAYNNPTQEDSGLMAYNSSADTMSDSGMDTPVNMSNNVNADMLFADPAVPEVPRETAPLVETDRALAGGMQDANAKAQEELKKLNPQDVGKKYIQDKLKEKELTAIEKAQQQKAMSELIAGLGSAGSTMGAAIGRSKSGQDLGFWDKMSSRSGDALKQANLEQARQDKKDKEKRDNDLKKFLVSNKKNGDLKNLPETAVTKISSYEDAFASLSNLENVLNKNKDRFGRVSGTTSKVKAFLGDADSQFVIAQMDKVRQFVGKALEGGVLRKEDEDKYKRILGDITKNPKALFDIMGEMKKDMANNRNTYLKNLSRADYKVANFEQDINKTPTVEGNTDINKQPVMAKKIKQYSSRMQAQLNDENTPEHIKKRIRAIMKKDSMARR